MTARHCSRCSKPGHNFRTCGQSGSGGGVKLFGVQLTDGAGCFTNCATTTTITNAPLCSRSSSSSASFSIQRKKAAAWSEEEHRRFLVGLKKLGKGNWRGIAYSHVFSRTPTQVASHAQKYFLRQNDTKKRRRRSSLFDIGMESERKIDQLVPVENEQQPLPLPSPPTPRGPENSSNPSSCPQLSLDQEPKPYSRYPISQAVRDIIAYNNNNIQLPPRPMLYPVMLPVFYPYCPARRPTSPALPNESRIVDDRNSQGPRADLR